MTCLIRHTLVLTALYAGAVPAQAFGGWFAPTSYSATTYYYYPTYYTPVVPATVTYYYYPFVVETECPPVTRIPAYAQTFPAPPSQTAEPPVLPKPKVKEKRSFYQPVSNSPVGTSMNTDYCKVGFWNATRRDVAIQVNGQNYVLLAGRMTELTTPRNFVWRDSQGQLQTQTVPAGRQELEIVIRK